MKSNFSKIKSIFSLIFLLYPCFLLATPISIQGQVNSYFWSYEKSIDSFTLEIDGRQVSTGPIHASLDLTNPSEQTGYLDFDTMMRYASVDLIVTAPILGEDGYATIHIDESGPIELLNPSAIDQDILTLVTIGSTTSSIVTPGNIFLGLKRPKLTPEERKTLLEILKIGIEAADRWLEERRSTQKIEPGGGASISFEVSNSVTTIIDGTLINGGNIIPITGSGFAVERPTAFIPEPSTLALLFSSLSFLYIRKLRRPKKV